MKGQDGLQRLGRVGAISLTCTRPKSGAGRAGQRPVRAAITVGAIHAHDESGCERSEDVEVRRAVSENAVRGPKSWIWLASPTGLRSDAATCGIVVSVGGSAVILQNCESVPRLVAMSAPSVECTMLGMCRIRTCHHFNADIVVFTCEPVHVRSADAQSSIDCLVELTVETAWVRLKPLEITIPS